MASVLGLFSLSGVYRVMIGILNCESGCIAYGLSDRMKRDRCECELDQFIVDLIVLKGEGWIVRLDSMLSQCKRCFAFVCPNDWYRIVTTLYVISTCI